MLTSLLGDDKQEMPTINFISNIFENSFKHKGWILDSKAYGHVVLEVASLKSNTKSISTIWVTMPNEERVVMDGIKTMELKRIKT